MRLHYHVYLFVYTTARSIATLARRICSERWKHRVLLKTSNETPPVQSSTRSKSLHPGRKILGRIYIMTAHLLRKRHNGIHESPRILALCAYTNFFSFRDCNVSHNHPPKNTSQTISRVLFRKLWSDLT